MAKSETTEYNSKTWRRYPQSKRRSDREYFKLSQTNSSPVYLHRQIWEDNFGAIPDGYHVHHKDGNCQNNDLSNLELLSAKEHVSGHTKERLQDDSKRQELNEHLERIRPLTKVWHASEEGRAKHREIGAMAYQNFKPKPKPCKQCGEKFLPKKIGNADLFCSNACKSAWRRDSGVDDEQRQCIECGKQFATNKYSKVKTCCKSCAMRYAYKNRK